MTLCVMGPPCLGADFHALVLIFPLLPLAPIFAKLKFYKGLFAVAFYALPIKELQILTLSSVAFRVFRLHLGYFALESLPASASITRLSTPNPKLGRHNNRVGFALRMLAVKILKSSPLERTAVSKKFESSPVSKDFLTFLLLTFLLLFIDTMRELLSLAVDARCL